MKTRKKLLRAAVVLAIILGAGFLFANSTDLQGRFTGVSIPTGLNISLAPAPISGTFIKGQEDVMLLGVNFSCVNTLDCVVDTVDLQGYLDDDGDRSAFATSSSTTTHGTSLSDYVSELHFVDSSGNPVGSSESVSSTTFEVTIMDVDYTISAGARKTLYLVGDISNRAYANGDAENISFGIPDTTLITAEDSDGSMLTVNGKVNDTQTVYFTTAESGRLSISLSSDSPADQLVGASTEFLLGSFTLTSTGEDFEVSRLKLRLNNIIAADSISVVKLKYPTDPSDPTTLDGSTSAFLSRGILSYTFSDFTAAANERTEFEIWVTTTAAAISDVGDPIKFNITTAADSISAIGTSSGTTVDGTDVLSATVSTNTATVD